MKKILAAAFLAVLVLVPAALFAAGTVVCVPDHVDGQTVTVYACTMTGDVADGSFPATQVQIDGWIIGVETDPGTAPTAGYDITLVDANAADVMMGALADRSATATERVIFPQPYVRGAAAITVANNTENSAVVVLKITVLR